MGKIACTQPIRSYESGNWWIDAAKYNPPDMHDYLIVWKHDGITLISVATPVVVMDEIMNWSIDMDNAIDPDLVIAWQPLPGIPKWMEG